MTSATFLCISNIGYEASLEPWKLYVALPDHEAEGLGMLRVIDESGEDYLFSKELFEEIELPAELEERFLAAAR